jgi:TM2 domain-containing membrane protein YozV
MNCAYHGQNVAVVNCNGCGKPLCPACDHRIKGFPYCQDCIVMGVDLLRNYNQSNYVPLVKANTSPFIATLLSFICPGLGAAYNGQTVKALIYFAVFVGLIQMAILTHMPVFVFGFMGMWLYTAVDAWKTAKLIRAGVTTEGAEDFIVQRFSGNPKLWGIVLTVLGVAFFLQAFFDFRRLVRGVLPVLLIILGAYLLRNYIFKSKNAKPKWENFARANESPTYISTANDASFRTGDLDFDNSFETRTRARSWKNQ